jgi:hypothetical protein
MPQLAQLGAPTTIRLRPGTDRWLRARAEANERRVAAEIRHILEAERARESASKN